MKRLIVLMTLFANSNVFGQQHIVTYYDVFKQHKQEVYDLDAQGEKNGKYISYFVGGRIEIERNYLHGKLNGKETEYYTDGYRYGLAHVYNYKNDKPDGLQQDYIIPEQGEMNGLGFHKQPAIEKFYGKTEAESWVKTYSEYNGKRFLLKMVQNCVEKQFDIHGHQWYQQTLNGRNFRDPDPTNQRVDFHTGESESSGYDYFLVNGKRNGLYKEWYYNGKHSDSIYYKDETLDGWRVQWLENGHLANYSHYKNGKVDGIYMSWWPNGQLGDSLYEKDGSGVYLEYDKDGKMISDVYIAYGEKFNRKDSTRYVKRQN